MKQKNVWRYGMSIVGIIGLASLLLPLYQAEGIAYNMTMLLRLGKSAGIRYCIILVGVILLSLAGNLVITLCEHRIANLTAGIIRIAAAVLLLVIRLAFMENLTGIPQSGLLDGTGLGFWLFLAIHIVSGILGIVSDRSGAKSAVVKESDSMSAADASAEAERKNGTIAILEGVYRGEEIPLEDMQALVVGRDAAQCNLVVEGEKVSRKHCSITYCARTGGYLLCDYSFNGTYYLNGQRLPKHMNMELPEGTEVYLGDKRNILRMGR